MDRLIFRLMRLQEAGVEIGDAIGVPTLDGLGAVGGSAHADAEHVVVDTMPDRVALLGGIIARVRSR